MFAKHVQEYMAEQGEECLQPATPSALPEHMSTFLAKSGALGVSVMQTIAGLLNAIMVHKDDLTGLSANKVVCMWPSHFRQFGTYITKMRDKNREVLQIADPKIIQGKINAVPWEKALRATDDEKVAFAASSASGRARSIRPTPKLLTCWPSM